MGLGKIKVSHLIKHFYFSLTLSLIYTEITNFSPVFDPKIELSLLGLIMAEIVKRKKGGGGKNGNRINDG